MPDRGGGGKETGSNGKGDTPPVVHGGGGACFGSGGAAPDQPLPPRPWRRPPVSPCPTSHPSRFVAFPFPPMPVDTLGEDKKGDDDGRAASQLVETMENSSRLVVHGSPHQHDRGAGGIAHCRRVRQRVLTGSACRPSDPCRGDGRETKSLDGLAGREGQGVGGICRRSSVAGAAVTALPLPSPLSPSLSLPPVPSW